ncbi:MAG: helix-turn-helix transcriptional regulator [Bacteroidaceae bacterium]|nr:helix-turn-helix transcriptional regulator [Bacteroidaceae bacterium]
MNSSNIEKILHNYRDLSPEWLLTGRGEMLRSDKPTQTHIPTAHPALNPTEGIPLIPLSAMAGALTSAQTVLEHECDRYVVPAFKGADFLIQVKGSSMYPKYSSGDIVACQRVTMDKLFFQWNKVYVIDTDQGALIKRIKPGHDKDHVLIVSDNEKYDPFELPCSSIYAVALVIGVIRLE